MTAPREPQEATLGEFSQYSELLGETGRLILAAEDELMTAETREAAREARRRGSAATADSIGRGRS